MSKVEIIVADDDASQVALLQKLLAKAGYTVLTCDNGVTAFELVQQHAPVLLISDWEMPGLNGLELCRKIRASQASDGTYILLLTGNDERTRTVAGLEAGADDYLVKARSHTELLARVQAGKRVLDLQRRLGEGEQWLRTVVDACKDAMIAIDGKGLVTLFNQTAETLFSRSREAMVGQPVDCLMAEEHRAHHSEHVLGYFACGEPSSAIGQTVELSAVRSDGRQFPVELSLSAGECRGEAFVLAVIRDITERKRGEESQRRLVRAVEAAADAIILTDVAGRIVQVNPAFTGITGYTSEEAVGQTPKLLKSGKQSIEFYRNMWETICSGRIWSDRIINKHKDGSLYHAELTIAPICDEKGNVTDYVGVQRDVSSRVRSEEELRGAHAAAKAALTKLQQTQLQLLQADKMASIGNLAAGVAHEINNPMGFITSNLNSLGEYATDLKRVLAAYDELLDTCQSGGTALTERVEAVARVRKEADIEYVISDLDNLIAESTDGARRVRQIVADLKDFSHVDSPDVVEEDINALLDKTVSVAWNELKYKTEVVREYGAMPPLPCYGGKLGQVFLNLLVNAAQAIDEQGTITIRTGHEGDQVWIEVADTGHGIPTENLERVFDPFFTTKEVGKGTGLGLHLTHTIVQAHGGRIVVKSRVGEGTTFRIELPVMGPPAAKESECESVS